jgi:hypothetical protein
MVPVYELSQYEYEESDGEESVGEELRVSSESDQTDDEEEIRELCLYDKMHEARIACNKVCLQELGLDKAVETIQQEHRLTKQGKMPTKLKKQHLAAPLCRST